MTDETRIRNEGLRDDIVDFLTEAHAFADVDLYCNGHCYRPRYRPGYKARRTKKGSAYCDAGKQDVTETTEYGNPDTLPMVFDGSLYRMLNYGRAREGLDVLARPHGLYHEMGHAWSLASHKIEPIHP